LSIEGNICAAETLCDLTETESELQQLNLLKKPEEKGKKVQPVTPFRSYEIDGFKILSGRNNIQNDRLLKSLSSEDIWLHTQKYHSTHVGILTDGKTVPDEVLLKAASICAYYSDASENNKVPVDYTQKKYVKKPPKANSGFVIYTDYNTIIVTPDACTQYKKD
jgi:predicted ribosome quality control (RQC) complex YloA/Tae2 family protein